ncbi:MAG: O-antigen ligase family protein [Pseudomonadota bacterium]
MGLSLSKISGYSVLITLFAIALQIQLTLFSAQDYQGLRLNSADLMLPPLGLFILFNLWTKRSSWPQWAGRFGYWAIALLSGVLMLSLLNGYVQIDEWQSWALINKFIGWLVLMAYLGAGAWIATNAPPKIWNIFKLIFVGFFCASVLVEIARMYMRWELGMDIPTAKAIYIEGFMQNRNAYAFLFLICALIISAKDKGESSRYWRGLTILFWVLAPLFVMLNGSRALMLCLAPLLGYVAIKNRSAFFKTILPCVLIFGAIGLFAFQNFSTWIARPIHHTAILMESSENKAQYAQERGIRTNYNHSRLALIRDSVELIKDYPLTGAGLGGIIHHQKEKYGEMLSVMDNTLLWILTEMGPFGLFSFVLVYIVMTHTLYRRKDESTLYESAFVMLIAFGAFSMFHEILYTRFFWFILGMALAVPIAHHRQSTPQA